MTGSRRSREGEGIHPVLPLPKPGSDVIVVQRERLIAFGCELGQGYLFSKSLEPAAASALLGQSAQEDRHTA